jgi:hypothetical protein
MPSQPFDVPKLKINRARRHIADFESESAAYLSRDPWALVLEFDENTKKHRIALRWRESVPSELSAIFGDAIHNLRVALDILANDLVVLSGRTPRKVYFPFADSRERFEDQLKKKMRGVAPDMADMIRSLKPYRGGNELLRSLHDLDIVDKHIAIIQPGAIAATPALPMMQTGCERIPGSKRNILTFEANFSALPTIPVDESKFIARANKSNIRSIGQLFGSECQLAIANGFSCAHAAPVPLLNKMADMVQGIVETFEEHLLGNQKSVP